MRKVFGILIGALVLTGCKQNVDLNAIATLGKTTADGQAAFAALSNDFYDSCVRTVGWERAIDPTGVYDVTTICADNAKAARQWQSANSIVTSYVIAIGNLAGGPDEGDYGMQSLATTFGQLGVTKCFSDSQVQAVSGAASSLISDYFKFKRREDLATIIPSANASLKSTITVLEDVAKTNYVTQLTTERNSIGVFVGPNMARAKIGYERVYVEGFRVKALSTVDTHQAAIDHYVAALENIEATHQKMADAIANNKASDMSSIVHAYASEYAPEVSALQKAFQ